MSSAAPPPPTPSVTSEGFRDVIGRFASGVTVVTTIEHDEIYGTTASAMSSLSLEPPMLLVCMNRDSVTGRAIARTGAFAVSILADNQDWVARQFARKGGDKFKDVILSTGPSGQPLINGSLAQLECRVVQPVSAATHVVLLAEVDHASAVAGAPLAYFRGEFRRFSSDATHAD